MPTGAYTANGNAGCATLNRSSSGGLSNIGALPGTGFDQSATRSTTGPKSGLLPGLNLANVVAQLMVSPYYNSNVRFFLVAAFSLALAAGLGTTLTTLTASAQIDPKTAMLEKAGFDALNAGQTERAIAAFREAVVADPKNAALHLGLGVAAYTQQRDADAKSELERALELQPQLTQAREFLGLVLHHQGDLPGAIRLYETLTAAAPQNATSTTATTAADTLERWRHELELRDTMQQTLGEHFTVSFEGPAEAGLAARAVESLERAYDRICPLLSISPTVAVPVVLYTSEQFQDVTRSPAWAAASYDGTIRVPVGGALAKGRELDRVLAHEFTHALVHTLAPRTIPTWLNEGLASALETDDITWATTAVTRARAPVPLTVLTRSFAQLNGADAALAYATSAVAVRRLLDTIGGTGVANLIRDLGEGVDFDQAFAHRAQEPFTDFMARLAP